ncbi:3-beta-hydroxysteroid-Delta(8),Delta(7)-isomerase-like isoform X1 [Acanthaster planci]|uniref:3-beta-hydroxysteroid-Delta(8), Delta(7)-isomerase-like isoform X1 n=1 Tax=Acanthaster planci TaxID=133434 RepID=A0A8B7XK47_ACAPL|nr:3-beta-hydroxysteroid-Delta(8),Delta(7)-isomerase-like isoform X1 [Acanthaster planci]
MASRAADANVSHPYYPLDLSLPHYKENALPFHVVVAVVVVVFAAVYLAGWIVVKRDRFGRLIRIEEKVKLSWFWLSGCIHLILEGYLTLTSGTIAGSNNILAQIWKEYAKGDSRYVSNDTCTIVMETITAWLEGPGCLLTVWAFTTRHPMRYVMQLAVSIGQTYGVLIYFITEYYDDFAHGPLFHPVYFWLYVIGFNAPWVILPPIFIRQSWQELNKAQRALDKANGFMPPSDGQGKSKKKK